MTSVAKANDEHLKAATSAVIKKDLDNLYEELGMRSKAISIDVTRMGDPTLTADYDGDGVR
jgi:hypothetical protein